MRHGTAGLCALMLGTTALAAGTAPPVDRTVLPIAAPTYPASVIEDARDAKAPPLFRVRAPEGAPNVVLILLDDMGFGQPSSWGGPVNMPTLASLQAQGLAFNRFHVTALCSPTRTALLTGANHHANNAGSIMELATSFPGYTAVRPVTITPMPEVLRQNGWSTAAFGKYHETPPWEISLSGPITRWPTLSGFDKFYGFIGGEANQYAPAVYDGVTRVHPPRTPDYLFIEDMTNQAIAWVRAQQALTPDKPFFLYFSTGATHAPHHVPRQWADRYKGQFDQGWDRLREATFARQKALGVIPKDAKLTPRPAEIPAWDSLSEPERKLLARQMEVFAGFGEQTDHEIGRLLKAIADMGELDNTLVIYIAGDNGASAEGGLRGTANELMALNGIGQTVAQMDGLAEQWGGPETYPHYAVGWAWAGNTPFQWTKQVASHLGGTRNGMVMRWPAGLAGVKPGVRSQFHHVIDVAPTIYEAAGIPAPVTVNGYRQRPLDGVSMLYAARDAGAPDARRTQYFEMFGNRAIYHDGWWAAARHSIPWELGSAGAPLSADRWELYDLTRDYSQAQDLAAANPAKLAELQAVFEREAIANNVFPMDVRRAERFNPSIAGRPDLLDGRTSQTFYAGMTGMAENAVVNTKSVHHKVTAEIETDGRASGVIAAQAGRFGGWTLYMTDGRPAYEFNWFNVERFPVVARAPLAPGKQVLEMEFVPDGPKPGTGGVATLRANGVVVAQGRVERTIPFAYSADEGLDIGVDTETNVSNAYPEGDNRFTGTIGKVTVARLPAS